MYKRQPFSELTPEERRIVFDGPAEKRHILYKAKKTDTFAELDFTYFNAVYTVENALAKAKDEKGLARVSKFLVERPCPACGGSRLNERARTCTLAGKTLPQAAALTLEESVRWVAAVPSTLPPSLAPMANSIAEQYLHTAQRLMDPVSYTHLATPNVASSPASSLPQNASRQPDFSSANVSESMSTCLHLSWRRMPEACACRQRDDAPNDRPATL